jgi:hypothetical protein
MNHDLNTTDLHTLAQRRVDIKMGFLIHLAVFVAVNLGISLARYLAGGSFQPFFPVWGWAIGLVAHGVGTAASLMGWNLRERLVSAELASLQRR